MSKSGMKSGQGGGGDGWGGGGRGRWGRGERLLKRVARVCEAEGLRWGLRLLRTEEEVVDKIEGNVF